MQPSGVPEAWPALLTMEQLRAYLGDVAEGTVRKICPVAPVDLGANVLRFRRAEVDAWLAGLPHRLPVKRVRPQDAAEDPPTPIPLPAADPAAAAVAKAQARARRGPGWKRSATSTA